MKTSLKSSWQTWPANESLATEVSLSFSSCVCGCGDEKKQRKFFKSFQWRSRTLPLPEAPYLNIEEVPGLILTCKYQR